MIFRGLLPGFSIKVRIDSRNVDSFPRDFLSASEGVCPWVFSIQGGALPRGPPQIWGDTALGAGFSPGGMPFLRCFSSALSGRGLALDLLLSSGMVPCVILLTRVKRCFCGSWRRVGECFLVAVPALSEDVSWLCYLRAVGPSPLGGFPSVMKAFSQVLRSAWGAVVLGLCVSALMRQLFLVVCSLSVGTVSGSTCLHLGRT